MKRIDCVDQYISLIENNEKRFSNIIYNVMLLPKEVNVLIEDQKLFYEMVETGLLFYVDERDFYKVYCFLSSEASLKLYKKEKPQIIEMIYSERRVDEKVKAMETKCKEAGMELYVENMRLKMTMANNEMIRQIKLREEMNWRFAGLDDIERIYDIWESLDSYGSAIPCEDELIKSINNEELVCVIKDGSICAVQRIKEENKKTCTFGYGTVAKGYRRQGLGIAMMDATFLVAMQKGHTYVQHWCDVKNRAIIETTKKYGFLPDGVKSSEYIFY